VRKRRRPRRQTTEASLTITSLMDTMTIILVFLLLNFRADAVEVPHSDDLKIPLSTADELPGLAVSVVVSRRNIEVDGEFVVDLERTLHPATGAETFAIPDVERDGQTISRLLDVLERKADAARRLGRATAADEVDLGGEILLQVDRRMPFSVVRDVLYTAGKADFGRFRFVVISTTAG
jgi:biopolymer transport protein ExbD